MRRDSPIKMPLSGNKPSSMDPQGPSSPSQGPKANAPKNLQVDPLAIREGHLLSRYIHLQKKLGTGSNGEAWLATADPRILQKLMSVQDATQGPANPIPEILVVKKVKSDLSREGAAAAVLKEVNVLRRLNHPNVVRYFDAWIETDSTVFSDGYLCIALEYCNEGDLHTMLNNQRKKRVRFPNDLVSALALQLLSAVAYCHSQRVIHRDIKPQNIFLLRRVPDQPTQLVLGDFGIARDLETTFGLAQSRVGTPYYVSPEIVVGHPYSNKTDVWAVGVLLFELMMLRRPFEPKNTAGIDPLYQAILHEDPIPTLRAAAVGHFDEWLIALCADCLIKQQEQRLHAADLLKKFCPLAEKSLGDLGLPPIPAPPPPSSPAKNNNGQQQQQHVCSPPSSAPNASQRSPLRNRIQSVAPPSPQPYKPTPTESAEPRKSQQPATDRVKTPIKGPVGGRLSPVTAQQRHASPISHAGPPKGSGGASPSSNRNPQPSSQQQQHNGASPPHQLHSAAAGVHSNVTPTMAQPRPTTNSVVPSSPPPSSNNGCGGGGGGVLLNAAPSTPSSSSPHQHQAALIASKDDQRKLSSAELSKEILQRIDFNLPLIRSTATNDDLLRALQNNEELFLFIKVMMVTRGSEPKWFADGIVRLLSALAPPTVDVQAVAQLCKAMVLQSQTHISG